MTANTEGSWTLERPRFASATFEGYVGSAQPARCGPVSPSSAN